MKNIRIDDNGDQRCWHCGGKHFTLKRTARSKVGMTAAGVLTVGAAAGLGALATQKKLKCQSCGKYNQVGKAERFVQEPERPKPTAKEVAAVVDHDAVWRQYSSGWRCVTHKMTVCKICPPREQE